jgi:hypothetical protein
MGSCETSTDVNRRGNASLSKRGQCPLVVAIVVCTSGVPSVLMCSLMLQP